MHHSSPPYPMPSHSNEIERRLTAVEVMQEERRSSNEDRHKKHETRLTYLERMLQFLIYAVGALAIGKSGDIADLAIGILKSKI